MSRWPAVPLGQLVDVLDHRRVPVSAKERSKRHGSVPYYGATGQVGWIDEVLFNEPLLLLGEDGVQFFDRDKRKAYLVDGPAWVNNHAHVLRARGNKVERRYLLHYLNWIDYHGLANGTTRLKLTKSAMCSVPVLLPELTEQRRIVEILEDHLSRLDAARVSVEQVLTRLNALALSDLSATLFRQFAWPTRPLSDVLEVSVGGVWGHPPGENERQVRVLRVTELKPDGRVDPTTAVTRSITESQFGRRALQPGDLLLEKSGGGPTQPVGRIGFVSAVEGESVCSNFMQLMRPGELVTPRFLFWYLHALYLRGGTLHMQKASTNIRNLKSSEYLQVPVPVPPLPVQHSLAAELDERAEFRSRNRTALRTLSARTEQLRHSLLTAAFSGELRSTTTTSGAGGKLDV